ncbi:hypothetical protein GCM10027321_41430 [Massilia terrae]
MRYLSTLDGIRAVAVILVVVSHLILQLTDGAEPAFYSYRTMGRIGVAIFFVHTTLVLMMSLQRHGPAAIPFYIRRIFRIYPLAIVTVLFFALLQLGSIPIDTGKLLSNLFLVQNITGYASLPRPLWSLPYELQMYLVLPALYHLARTQQPVLWAIALWLSATVLALLLPTQSLAHKLALYVPCFLPGFLAYLLAGRIRFELSSACLFAFIAIAGTVLIPMLVKIGFSEMPLFWVFCLAIGIIIPASDELQNRHIVRGASLVAKYSYGIYLTHVLAMGAIDGLVPGPKLVQWGAMLVLLIGLAYMSYHGIEKRGIALGMRLAERYASRSRRTNSRNTPDSEQASGF